MALQSNIIIEVTSVKSTFINIFRSKIYLKNNKSWKITLKERESHNNETIITKVIAVINAPLGLEVSKIRRHTEYVARSATVADYKPDIIDPQIHCLLQVIKSLSEFSGKQNKYVFKFLIKNFKNPKFFCIKY